MIAWINGRLHVMCDQCYARQEAPDAVDGVHVCGSCALGEPQAAAPAPTPARARRRLFRRAK